ncbi:hypothetical protein KUV28_17525 [Ferrimonas balearica]|nr:hypothetical protein [Ferrimonas balearica]
MDKSERQRRIAILVEQYGGVHPPHAAFYDRSIFYSGSMSLGSFSRFINAIHAGKAPKEVFAHLQDALTHAGGLSRFFFPIEARNNQLADARRSKLRSRYDVSDSSAIAMRGIRNALEHFDERLDEYSLLDPVGFFYPDPIVHDIAAIEDAQATHIFKLIDPEKGIAIILGKRFYYKEIFGEVERITSLAAEMP